MTKSNKKVLKAVLAGACALVCACSSLCVKAAYANPSSTETTDLGASGFSVENSAAVKQLIGELGSSYNALDKQLDNGGALTAQNFQSAKTVTMGGVIWNIMYVSKADYTANGTTAGDIVVTLWQSNSGSVKSYYSNRLMTGALTDKYPVNMYGASLVRSTLVGSKYLVKKGDQTLDGTGAINAAWQPFSATDGAFYDYLATPANMAWQQTLSAASTETIGREFSLVNDAWGTPSSENWQSDDNNYGARTGDTLTVYQSWKDDKIWLPSLAETGESDAKNGLWKTVAEQRKSTSQVWLRSGPIDGVAVYASALTSGSLTNQTIFQSRNVRPAVHLNLTLAAKAAGINTEHECTFGDWTVTKPATCTEEGSKTRTCTECGETETQSIPVDPTAHDFAQEFTVDKTPTCTESGSKSKHCTRCDEKTEVTQIEATGHSFTDYVKDDGGETETAVCDHGCGAKDTRQIDKPQENSGTPAWVWAVVAVGGVAVISGAIAAVIIVKKKRRG